MEILTTNFQVLKNKTEVKTMSLKDILSASQKTLLFFYPKDDTPWCTLENKEFTQMKNEFNALWIQLVWVSKDDIESHKTFCLNHSLENDLISDPELVLHKYFNAYWEKNNYWKIITWVIRTTILLDNSGKILKSWNSVKATWHVNRLLKELNK